MTAPQTAPQFGLGLRQPHYAEVLAGTARLDFVEVISENFMVPGGRPRDILRRVRALYPVALHGVSLSLGSAAGPDPDYLRRLRALADEIEPAFVSDHLCWTRTPGFQSHDLLPLPYTEPALALACEHVLRAQDALARPLLVENPSSYVTFARAEMAEWEFLGALAARTGCELLLDVNNLHVSAQNHGWDVGAYLDGLPLARVRQIHLAGHTARVIEGRRLLVDTHDQPVPPPVWRIFASAMARLAAPWVMIERDDNIPPLAELIAELDHARGYARPAVAA